MWLQWMELFKWSLEYLPLPHTVSLAHLRRGSADVSQQSSPMERLSVLFTCALNWNNLHPFPLLSLPPACFLLQFLGCLSQLLKGCASLGEICLGCILQIPSSSQTNNQFLSSLGPLLAFFLLGTALSQEFRDSAVEILLIGSNVQNTGFKNQGSQVQCGCACYQCRVSRYVPW